MYKGLLIITMALSLVACEKRTETIYTSLVVPSHEYNSGGEETFKETLNDHVFFKFNSSKLSVDAQSTLNKQAEWLNKHSDTILILEGHADERGTLKYNLDLSMRRAQVVKNYLMKKGVLKSRIRTVGFGKEHPDTLGHNNRAWENNRSVVMLVHKAS